MSWTFIADRIAQHRSGILSSSLVDRLSMHKVRFGYLKLKFMLFMLLAYGRVGSQEWPSFIWRFVGEFTKGF